MAFKAFKQRLQAKQLEEYIINIKRNKPFEDMSKQTLDDYALDEKNVELDRRQTKSNMIKEFIAKLKGDN